MKCAVCYIVYGAEECLLGDFGKGVENGGQKEKHGGKDHRNEQPACVTEGERSLREGESGDQREEIESDSFHFS